MYDKEDLKFKLQHYSERGDAELQGFVDILMKSIKDRLEEDKIYGVPYLTDKNLEDIVAKNTTMTMGTIEAVETKYDIDKMVEDYEDYYNELLNVIRFSNMKYENNTNELYNYVYLATLSLSKVWGNRYEAEVKDVGLMLETLYLPNLKYKGDEK